MTEVHQSGSESISPSMVPTEVFVYQVIDTNTLKYDVIMCDFKVFTGNKGYRPLRANSLSPTHLNIIADQTHPHPVTPPHTHTHTA